MDPKHNDSVGSGARDAAWMVAWLRNSRPSPCKSGPRTAQGSALERLIVCAALKAIWLFTGNRHSGHATLSAMGRGGKLGYRPELDGLRGIAVLLVIVNHAGLPYVAQAGSVGVTLFFVLSGFLITRLMLDQRELTGRVNFRHFYVRRARRLLPALCLLLIAVAAYLLASHQSLLPVVLAAGYSANIANATGHSLGNLDHLWTLSLEEQFYLLWPMLMPFVARRRNPALVLTIAAAASAAIRSGLWLSGAPIWRVYYGPDTRADAILIGCALAFVVTKATTPHWLSWAAITGAVTLAAACVMPGTVFIWLLIPLPVASAVVISWAVRHPSRILAWRPLVATGKISYGLYLWNLPLSLSLQSWDVPVGVRAALLLVVNFALAGLSWFVIESPIMRHPVDVAADTFAEVVAPAAEVRLV